jgi:hypothetical protein
MKNLGRMQTPANFSWSEWSEVILINLESCESKNKVESCESRALSKDQFKGSQEYTWHNLRQSQRMLQGVQRKYSLTAEGFYCMGCQGVSVIKIKFEEQIAKSWQSR